MLDDRVPVLTEPVPVSDVFATGRTIQIYKDYVRIVYFAEHPLMLGGEGLAPTEFVVVNKVILPRAAYMRSRIGILRAANTG
jgi:hypothetical protein